MEPIKYARTPFAEAWKVKTVEKAKDKCNYMDRINSGPGIQPYMEALDEDIIKQYEEQRETVEEFDAKYRFRDYLYNTIMRYVNWPCDVVITGSTVTLTGGRGSDCDACILVPNAGPIFDQHPMGLKKGPYEILNIVYTILKKDEEMKQRVNALEFIKAKIPILKFEYTCPDANLTFDVDISISLNKFVSGLYNSHIIREYAKFDVRFCPLVYLVKKWARAVKLHGPTDGGFNSYCLSLLLVHFLQSGVYPPVLPNLQALMHSEQLVSGKPFFGETERDFPAMVDFAMDLPKEVEELLEVNTMSVTELFARFCKYFFDFDFIHHRISVKTGQIYNRLNGEKIQVEIEDVIDSHNPGRTVRDIKELQNRTFGKTWAMFRSAAENTASMPHTMEMMIEKTKQLCSKDKE